ncbi:Cullin binding-domain-containing protein [Apodospora peruviana]|uniref:Defective in cullin neddylation protein n=1 Tax=Apodospora peruviana TaxID=516989 RepID=A0AAE0LZD3_9PEZI|nr:Cullin binding-domain-containing protein [Apodospora peruviana]
MTSLEERPDAPRVEFLGLFTSCFQKRSSSAHRSRRIKSVQQDGDGEESSSGTETGVDGDLTPHPRSQARQQPTPQDFPQTELSLPTPPPPSLQRHPGETPDMVKLDKLKSTAKWLNKPKSKYFSSHDSGRAPVDDTVPKLNRMFDELLSEQDKVDDPTGQTMDAESVEAYMQLLGVDHLSHELFVVLEIVNAHSLAKFTRSDFVDGWKAAYYDNGVQPDLQSHKRYVRSCIDKFARDPAYYKKVYQHAFMVGKEPAQKALDKEIAIAFWDSLLGPAGAHPWRSDNVDWLEVWKGYLEERWTRSVNKDMWNQTLIFADKAMEDETLGFWNEDQAWPGVIDDFVLWCHKTGVVSGGMDVDN